VGMLLGAVALVVGLRYFGRSADDAAHEI